MKFRVISDIHNEFFTNNGNRCHYELPVLAGEENMCLLMAGDIGLLDSPKTYESFVKEMCSRHKHVFWIEGNHEFYHGNISKHSVGNVVARMKIDYQWSNLYTREFPINDEKIVVLGCTLWTDFDNGNPITMIDANNGMNDHHIIKKGEEYSKFRAEDACALHHVQRNRLFKDIERYKEIGYKVIVVTHHHPSFEGVHPEYIGDRLNGAYCTNLYEDIKRTEPDYWICGHIHYKKEYLVHNTKVICNPLGYYYYNEKTGFDPICTIEL